MHATRLAPWLAPLLTGCFYAKVQAGWAPRSGQVPWAVAASAHTGVIPSAEVHPRRPFPQFDVYWFGDSTFTWSWGTFVRARGGPEQAQVAAGPEIALGLNPGRYPVAPYARLAVHALQVDRFRATWGGAIGSPLAEVGLANCMLGEDVPCVTLAAVGEYDLRFGPAPSTPHLALLAGLGVGF